MTGTTPDLILRKLSCPLLETSLPSRPRVQKSVSVGKEQGKVGLGACRLPTSPQQALIHSGWSCTADSTQSVTAGNTAGTENCPRATAAPRNCDCVKQQNKSLKN